MTLNYFNFFRTCTIYFSYLSVKLWWLWSVRWVSAGCSKFSTLEEHIVAVKSNCLFERTYFKLAFCYKPSNLLLNYWLWRIQVKITNQWNSIRIQNVGPVLSTGNINLIYIYIHTHNSPMCSWKLLCTSSLHLMLGCLVYLREVIVMVVWVRLRLWDT